MKTTLQTGIRILTSRYLSSRGCGDNVYVTGPPGIFCPSGDDTTTAFLHDGMPYGLGGQCPNFFIPLEMD